MHNAGVGSIKVVTLVWIINVVEIRHVVAGRIVGVGDGGGREVVDLKVAVVVVGGGT